MHDPRLSITTALSPSFSAPLSPHSPDNGNISRRLSWSTRIDGQQSEGATEDWKDKTQPAVRPIFDPELGSNSGQTSVNAQLLQEAALENPQSQRSDMASSVSTVEDEGELRSTSRYQHRASFGENSGRTSIAFTGRKILTRSKSVRSTAEKIRNVGARVAARVANVQAVEDEIRPATMLDHGDVELDEDDFEESKHLLADEKDQIHIENDDSIKGRQDDLQQETAFGRAPRLSTGSQEPPPMDTISSPGLHGKSLGMFGPDHPLRLVLFAILQQP